MTEQVYPTPLSSFKTDTVPTPVFTVPIMAQGAAALEQINEVCLLLQVPALQHRSAKQDLLSESYIQASVQT